MVRTRVWNCENSFWCTNWTSAPPIHLHWRLKKFSLRHLCFPLLNISSVVKALFFEKKKKKGWRNSTEVPAETCKSRTQHCRSSAREIWRREEACSSARPLPSPPPTLRWQIFLHRHNFANHLRQDMAYQCRSWRRKIFGKFSPTNLTKIQPDFASPQLWNSKYFATKLAAILYPVSF